MSPRSCDAKHDSTKYKETPQCYYFKEQWHCKVKSKQKTLNKKYFNNKINTEPPFPDNSSVRSHTDDKNPRIYRNIHLSKSRINRGKCVRDTLNLSNSPKLR